LVLAASAGPLALASGDTDGNPETGAIVICKMMADPEGVILNESTQGSVSFPDASFSVWGMTPPQTSAAPATGEFGTFYFHPPLPFTHDFLGFDGLKDAECQTATGLPLGSYYYDREGGPAGWQTPRYNDQVFGAVSGFGDFAEYDATLFDGDASNDGARDLRADGHIVLTADGDLRTLVVLNQLASPAENGSENTEELCSDDEDNDGDGLVDAEDPDCAAFQEGDAGGGSENGNGEEENGNSGGNGSGGGNENGNNNGPENAPGENNQGLCTDALDNDGDGLVDLADPECGPVLGVGPGQGGEGITGGAAQTASPSGGEAGGENAPAPTGEVLGASTGCSEPFMNAYVKFGAANDEQAVRALQEFLNEELGLSLPVTGFYGPATFSAVKEFQLKYWEQILKPWEAFGFDPKTPSGYVYKTTSWWINELQCPNLENPFPQLP
jgi:hypothetical protein